MEVVEADKSMSHGSVYVYHGNGKAVRQPNSFQFSPHGVEIYNRKKVPMYELVEFTMEFPDDPNEAITCTCIVAKTRFDAALGLHRIWMKFLDLPDSACKRIHAMTKTSKDLCPFCENY